MKAKFALIQDSNSPNYFHCYHQRGLKDQFHFFRFYKTKSLSHNYFCSETENDHIPVIKAYNNGLKLFCHPSNQDKSDHVSLITHFFHSPSSESNTILLCVQLSTNIFFAKTTKNLGTLPTSQRTVHIIN